MRKSMLEICLPAAVKEPKAWFSLNHNSLPIICDLIILRASAIISDCCQSTFRIIEFCFQQHIGDHRRCWKSTIYMRTASAIIKTWLNDGKISCLHKQWIYKKQSVRCIQSSFVSGKILNYLFYHEHPIRGGAMEWTWVDICAEEVKKKGGLKQW